MDLARSRFNFNEKKCSSLKMSQIVRLHQLAQYKKTVPTPVWPTVIFLCFFPIPTLTHTMYSVGAYRDVESKLLISHKEYFLIII